MPKDLRFLIINPFGIGDVLFTTPIIRAIKEKYPDSFIGYWCNLRLKPLLGPEPKIDKLFSLSRGDLKKIYEESFFDGLCKAINLAWSVRREHFDICLDFSLDHRYSLFSKIVGIKKRVGFDYKGRGRFLTHKIAIDGYHGKHAVEYYLSLLRFLDIEPKDKSLALTVASASIEKARDILSGRGIEAKDLVIGIAPGGGGSWGKDASYKHWPALKFAQVADRLANELKAKIIIVGDESERPIADIMVSAMRNKPVDLVGKVSLDVFAGLISNFHLFLTNDGGPMHMAVALGIKTVSVFGPVSEVVYGPYPDSRNHVVLKWDLDCRPCYKNFRIPVCDKDKECLRSVSVEDVFTASCALLK